MGWPVAPNPELPLLPARASSATSLADVPGVVNRRYPLIHPLAILCIVDTGANRREREFQLAMDELDGAQRLAKRALARVRPEDLAPGRARALVAALGSMEKLVSAAAVRYSGVAGKDAATVLAGARGTSVSKARAGLAVADQLSAVPVAREAFRAGELSLDQAMAIAPAAVAAPERAGALVEAARTASVSELRQEAARAMQRARGDDAQAALERRLHERRYCRITCPDGGGVRFEAFLSAVDGSKLRSAIEREGDRVFADLWKAGVKEERHERVLADALVRLVSGTARGTPGASQVLVRVDAAALVRGSVGTDEICEIDGVGPVSVRAATELLGEGFFTLLVQDGSDIRTVTSTTRVVPGRVEKALMLRDTTCCVPGCGATHGLQTDHWRLDFARRGPTQLDNLCRLCGVHHRMKTRTGWRLLGGPGRWEWPPPRQRVLPARARP